MKKTLILLTFVLLVGCTPTIVKKKFPDVPHDMMMPCPELKQVDPKQTKLSGVLDVVIENYSNYHECSVKVESWINWYDTQKSIDESVK